MTDYLALSGIMIAVIGSIVLPLGIAFKNALDNLHQRVSNIKDNYVRRDDADKSMNTLMQEIKYIRENQSKINDNLTALLLKIGNTNNDGSKYT